RGQRPINEQWDRMGTEVGPSGGKPRYSVISLAVLSSQAIQFNLKPECDKKTVQSSMQREAFQPNMQNKYRNILFLG
ncbi:putative collagen triple helix repeat-containing domain protein, partial [Trichinella spiralis]|uniref:putative collagen triple helix repeat-containing domain protein n=1 Tax=Trichinella spiralis TaxID=6334 RepID=UPI0001EFDC4C